LRGSRRTSGTRAVVLIVAIQEVVQAPVPLRHAGVLYSLRGRLLRSGNSRHIKALTQQRVLHLTSQVYCGSRGGPCCTHRVVGALEPTTGRLTSSTVPCPAVLKHVRCTTGRGGGRKPAATPSMHTAATYRDHTIVGPAEGGGARGRPVAERRRPGHSQAPIHETQAAGRRGAQVDAPRRTPGWVVRGFGLERYKGC
jgi:hypothetical protein